MRKQLLAGVSGVAGNVQALSEQIEQNADTVELCIVRSTGAKPGNVVTMTGRFPADLQAKLQASLPGVRARQLAGREVLVNDKNWLVVTSERIVWANDDTNLARALDGSLAAPPLPPNLGVFTSITPQAEFGGMASLAKSLGLAAGDWERLTLAMTKDSASSEVRIHASSEKAASRSLAGANAQLAEVRSSPVPQHQQVAAGLSVEADGLSVAFRYGGSLSDLASALQSLKPAKHGHGHGHD
jgi:hypothetical protein